MVLDSWMCQMLMLRVCQMQMAGLLRLLLVRITRVGCAQQVLCLAGDLTKSKNGILRDQESVTRTMLNLTHQMSSLRL